MSTRRNLTETQAILDAMTAWGFLEVHPDPPRRWRMNGTRAAVAPVPAGAPRGAELPHRMDRGVRASRCPASSRY
jgi:hypothetical protein